MVPGSHALVIVQSCPRYCMRIQSRLHTYTQSVEIAHLDGRWLSGGIAGGNGAYRSGLISRGSQTTRAATTGLVRGCALQFGDARSCIHSCWCFLLKTVRCRNVMLMTWWRRDRERACISKSRWSNYWLLQHSLYPRSPHLLPSFKIFLDTKVRDPITPPTRRWILIGVDLPLRPVHIPRLAIRHRHLPRPSISRDESAPLAQFPQQYPFMLSRQPPVRKLQRGNPSPSLLEIQVQ